LDYNIELLEFFDQLDFCLSLRFKDKWRHRYSEHFINIFQERVLKAVESQKPLKKSTLVIAYTKKHKYDIDIVNDFFDVIDLSLYYPVIYDDRK
jgi:hypothetical protein